MRRRSRSPQNECTASWTWREEIRAPPEDHAQAYREMLRQACDAAVREARRRQEGHIADDAQELLALIQPRLLLPAPKRKEGPQNAPKTHAEVMAETAHMKQEAHRLVGERLAIATTGNWAQRLRKDELEAEELKQHKKN